MKKILYSLTILFLSYLASYGQVTYVRTVVHVLYTSSANNITDITVQNYINEVNKGFSKQLTPTFTRANSIFDTLWANTNIQLCLATLTPNGITTNGITHDLISYPFGDTQNPDAPIWDANTYFNIYLTPVYPQPGFPSFVLGGWASSPTSPQMGATFNYAVVATNSIPLIPQLLVHEIGHVFGLEHVNSDLISDTPSGIENISPATGYSSVCLTSLQNSNTTTLTQDGMHWGGVDPPDMVENFMGLSFCCCYMFTKGQKYSMNTYIQTHLSNWISNSCNLTSIIDDSDFSNSLTIFPNPSKSSFTITSASNTIQTIKITDILGKEIKSVTLTEKEYKINAEEMQSGIYFLLISDDKQNACTKKIVIQ
jgi:hypothetical protein